MEQAWQTLIDSKTAKSNADIVNESRKSTVQRLAEFVAKADATERKYVIIVLLGIPMIMALSSYALETDIDARDAAVLGGFMLFLLLLLAPLLSWAHGASYRLLFDIRDGSLLEATASAYARDPGIFIEADGLIEIREATEETLRMLIVFRKHSDRLTGCEWIERNIDMLNSNLDSVRERWNTLAARQQTLIDSCRDVPNASTTTSSLADRA